MKTLLISFVAGLLVEACAQLHGQVAFHPAHRPPPPAPPPFSDSREIAASDLSAFSSPALYSIGEPTAEEQLYIEYINRARSNPAGEGQIFASTTDFATLEDYDFFQVNLNMMIAEFAVIPVAPPVAPSAKLTEAARRHSNDMLTHSFQDHVGRDGSTLVSRIRDVSYQYRAAGENVYVNAESVFHGHAGFEVDWGYGDGGMQPARGHRRTIHNPDFREVGVGVVFGSNKPAPGNTGPEYQNVGPQLVTQDFGTLQNGTPFITGVAYYDLNGNNFYDLGEGIGGVSVNVAGSAYAAITSKSGGYAVPVPTNGQFTVTFSGTGFEPLTRQVSVTQLWNQKLDFVPPYAPPVVLGSGTPAASRLNTYSIRPVAGATDYQWRHFQLTSPAVEGAENGTNRVTIEQSGVYNVFEGGVRASGSYSFHLVHAEPVRQSITLKPSYLIGSNSVLRFQSRLGYATRNQFAVVQVSTDEGTSWNEIYRQAGSNGPGESSFTLRELTLGIFAGATIQVRFEYAIQNGGFYFQEDPSAGWLIDDIGLMNASEISREQIGSAPAGIFQFQPEAPGSYVLQARARSGFDYLPWGQTFAVQAVDRASLPTAIEVETVSMGQGRVELIVKIVDADAPNLSLQFKERLDQQWSPLLTTVQPLSLDRFRVSGGVLARWRTGFFRVVAD